MGQAKKSTPPAQSSGESSRRSTGRASGRPARKVKSSLRRRLRYLYYRFIRLHSSPRYLARGLAVGVFSGFLPFFGFQIFLSVAIASLVQGHKVVAAAATWISNPLTYLPLYGLGFHVGRRMLGSPEMDFNAQMFKGTQAVWTFGGEFAAPLITGCVTLGLIASVISYFAAMYLLIRAKRRRPKAR